MYPTKFLSTLLAASLLVVPAQRAAANDGLVGGIVGGIVGGVIVNEASKNRQRQRARTTTTRRAPSVNSYQRQQNREVQTSLNYFGFPSGTPDGVLGRNSRSAISQYQAHMGYTPSGYLTDYERTFLVSSYQRAISGGAYTAQQIAATGIGPKGLLITYRNEAAGIVTPQPGVTGVPQNQAGTVVIVPQQQVPVATQGVQQVATTPVVTPQEAAPAPAATPTEAPSAASPSLPTFGVTQASRSMASHCNEVSLVTSSNGGFTTVANVSDPVFTLSEQFCLARTYAIADGEALARQVQGVSLSDMDKQCEGFVPAMKQQIASLSINNRDQVVQEVSQFALSTGQAPAQLASTARICLSSGYRTDNSDVALASSLILVALGEAPYGELLGHHLSQGFGASVRNDLALPWYQSAITALDNGATAVFAPSQTDRADLLRIAVGGGGKQASTGEAVVVPAFNVPTNN